MIFTARVLAEFARTKLRRFRDRAHLEAWQVSRAERHLARLCGRSEALAARGEARDWRSWPLTDKAAMMAEFDELNTAGLGRDECLAAALLAERERDFGPRVRGYTVGLSSGTSGHRGLFVVSEVERARWAGTVLARLLPRWWGKHRVAFFLRASGHLYDSVRSSRIAFDWYDLLDPPERHLERLLARPPTVLVAPPSVLRWLADEGAPLRPERVLAVAEVLDPVDEPVIARAFGPVHQVYQATEGLLGASCERGTLHLCEDLVHVEPQWLDDERFVPIVTDLWRTTQPIVRYRLDDVLVAGECGCGSPYRALRAVEGRCDDVLRLPGGVRLYADFVRSAILAVDGISAYAVRQTATNRLEIDLAGPGDPEIRERAVSAEIARLWTRVGVASPTLVFGTCVDRPSSRKRKRVSCELPALQPLAPGPR